METRQLVGLVQGFCFVLFLYYHVIGAPLRGNIQRFAEGALWG